MITLTKSPGQELNPIENCIPFNFLTDDYITQLGGFALFGVIIDSFDIQNIGDSVVILGKTYTVDTVNSQNTWVYDQDSIVHATNFANMFRSNHDFQDWNIYISEIQGDSYQVLVVAKRFFEVDMQVNISNLTTQWTFARSNGSNLITRKDFKIIYQIFCSDGTQVCPQQAVTPIIRKDTNLVVPVPIDFQHELSSWVKTTIPRLDQSTIIKDETVKKDFYVRYAERWIENDCDVVFSDFKTSDTFRVINSALQINDDIGLPFYYGFQGQIDFLTSSPLVSYLCDTSYMWNWICFNLNEKLNNPFFQSVKLELLTEYLTNNITITTLTTDFGIIDDGVYIIPIGPKNQLPTIPTVDFDEYKYYLIVTANYGSLGTVQWQLTPTRTIKLSECQCNNTFNLLFLSTRGGYDTLSCFKVVERFADTEMNDICVDSPCGSEFDLDGISNGKININGKTFEKITLETEMMPNDRDYQDLLLDFKASEDKILIDKSKSGQDFMRRILIESGSTKLYELNSKIKIRFTAIYSQNYNNQSS